MSPSAHRVVIAAGVHGRLRALLPLLLDAALRLIERLLRSRAIFLLLLNLLLRDRELLFLLFHCLVVVTAAAAAASAAAAAVTATDCQSRGGAAAKRCPMPSQARPR